MSQNKDDKTTPPRAPADSGLPKRPVPTIDLKATEVKAETKPAAGASWIAPGASAPASSTPASSTQASPNKPADSKPSAGAPAAAVPNVDPKSQASAPPRPGASVPPLSPASSSRAPSSSSSAPSAPIAVVAQSSGFGIGRALSYLSAAVLGGLMAIFGADFLAGTLGLDVRPSSPATPVVEELTTRLKKLEQSAAQPATIRTDTAALKGVTDQLAQANERIAKLEGANRQLAALSDAQSKLVESTRALETRIGQASPAEATGRIAKLEETIQGLAAIAQAQPGRPLPEMARLNTKLGEIETAVAALRKSGSGGEAMAQIEARLAEARKAEARKAEAQMTETVTQLKAESATRLREIEVVKTQAERLEQRVEAAKTDAGAAKSNVDALKTDVTAQLQTVARQSDLKTSFDGVDKRVAGIETRLETMSKRDDERQANSERIVVSLQLANLKRVMEQGKHYGDALAEVEKVAAGLVDLAPLKAHRDKGVMPTAELTAQFRQLTRNVLEAEQDQGQTSTVNRLLNSAKSVVQIRRVGADVQGDGAEALLARAEHHLKSGDLVTAAKEMKALKPELRSVAQGWLDQLEARVTVDRAVKAIEDKLKTSIAGTPAAGPAAGKGGKP
jgi:Mitochondrial inner membrane protein